MFTHLLKSRFADKERKLEERAWQFGLLEILRDCRHSLHAQRFTRDTLLLNLQPDETFFPIVEDDQSLLALLSLLVVPNYTCQRFLNCIFCCRARTGMFCTGMLETGSESGSLLFRGNHLWILFTVTLIFLGIPWPWRNRLDQLWASESDLWMGTHPTILSQWVPPFSILLVIVKLSWWNMLIRSLARCNMLYIPKIVK